MPTGTVKLHRVFKTKPERIYRAFLDAAAMAKWIPPYGFTCTVHQMDPKVGGTFKMSFTNFTTGHTHTFGGEYLELIPNEKLRYTDKFDDPNLPGAMQVTVSLKQVVCGTEVNIVQAYPLIARPHGRPAVALMVDNLEMAMETLANKGFTMITEGDLSEEDDD